MKAIKFISAAAVIALFGFASCTKTDATGLSLDNFDGVIETDQVVDLGLSVKWAGLNIGAEKPSECGYYFAAGEDTTRVYYSVEDYVVDSVVVCPGYKSNTSVFDPAKKHLGEFYSFPTSKQIQELSDSCTVKMCKYDGVVGYAVTGPNGKSIFFPCAGYKAKDQTFNNNNNPTYQATYWVANNGSLMYFKNDNTLNTNTTTNKYLGRPVRPVYIGE